MQVARGGSAGGPCWGLGLVLMVLAAAGCPPPARYRIVQPGLACAQANRLAYRTMVALGYRVAAFEPARPGGTGQIEGEAGPPERPTRVQVAIRCAPGATELQPIEEGLMPSFHFSRAFLYSFTTLAGGPLPAPPGRVAPPAAGTGLEVRMHPLGPHEAALDLPVDPAAARLVAVRVTVRNGTRRRLGFDPLRVRLVTAGGRRVAPLAPGEVWERLGGGRDLHVLVPAELGPGQVLDGFLFYPGGSYTGARVRLEDKVTGEVEGLGVEF